MVSVDVKHHVYLLHPWLGLLGVGRAQELCESRGGCPELAVPNSPYGLCGRKATLILQKKVGVGAKRVDWSVGTSSVERDAVSFVR